MIKRHPKLASALGTTGNGEDGPPEIPDYTAKLPMDQKLYFQYYVQDDVEDGTLMDTKIPIDEVQIFFSKRKFIWIYEREKRRYSTIKDHIRPHKATQGHKRPQKNTKGHKRPQKTTQGHTRPHMLTAVKSTRPYEVTQGNTRQTRQCNTIMCHRRYYFALIGRL